MHVHDRRFLVIAGAVPLTALFSLHLMGMEISLPSHRSGDSGRVSSKDVTVVRDSSSPLGWRLEGDRGFRVQRVEIVGHGPRTAIDWVAGSLGGTFFEGRDPADGHVRWTVSEQVDLVRFAGGVAITYRRGRGDGTLRGYDADDARLLWETSIHDDPGISLSGDPEGLLITLLHDPYAKTLTVSVHEPRTGARLRTETVDFACRMGGPPATFHATLTTLADCGDPTGPLRGPVHPTVPIRLDVEAFALGASSGWLTVSPTVWTSRAKMV